jgi:nitrous oxidase accessory protein NosD
MTLLQTITNTRFRCLIMAAIGVISVCQTKPAYALAVVFVSADGSGSACSQAAPCSLATGLSTVDEDGTLYAAAGTYTSGSGDQVVLLDKTINFLGGWDGSPAGGIVRDPASNVSIIDGQNIHRGITISGAFTLQPVVDGWTIQNGNATEVGPNPDCEVLAGSGYGCGGGIYVHQAEPEILNNIIQDNIASTAFSGNSGGGGIYIWESDATLVRWNTIRRNDAHIDGPGQGGGIMVIDSAGKTSILDNEIAGNEDSSSTYTDHRGAGLYIHSSEIQVHGNRIQDNNPDGFSFAGSGVFLYSCDNALWIDQNLITGNLGDTAVTLAYSLGRIQQNTIINP